MLRRWRWHCFRLMLEASGALGFVMATRALGSIFLAAGLFLTGPSAFAQLLNPQIERRQGFELQPMNFDLWCRETVRYTAERCTQRLTGDMREFEEYRSIIERFELESFMEDRRDAETLKQVDRDYGEPWVDYSNPRVR